VIAASLAFTVVGAGIEVWLLGYAGRVVWLLVDSYANSDTLTLFADRNREDDEGCRKHRGGPYAMLVKRALRAGVVG
jgi:hypothetical protein